MKTVQREIASGVVFSKDNKILMGMKDPASGGVYVDCLHLPGGGVGEGETKIEAVIREVKEEVGITIDESQIDLFDDQGSGTSEKTNKETGETYLCEMHFNVYRIDIDKNAEDIEVTLSDDLATYTWVPLDELATHKLTPPSVELFTRLGYI